MKQRIAILPVFFLGVALALVSFATPAKADQTVFLNYDTTTCTQYIGSTAIVGAWFSNTTGDQYKSQTEYDIYGNWTCYPTTGVSYQMKIFYDNSFCKCLATDYADDQASMYLNNGVWTFRSNPFTLDDGGSNPHCIF